MTFDSFVAALPAILVILSALSAFVSVVNRVLVDPVKFPRLHAALATFCAISPADVMGIVRAVAIARGLPPPGGTSASGSGAVAPGANGKAPPLSSRGSLIGALAVGVILAVCLLPGIVRQASTAPCATDNVPTLTQATPASDFVAPANDNGISCVSPMAGQGCAWWQGNAKSVTNDAGQIASCVIAQLFEGASDPLAITAACLPATVADVEQIVASLISFYDQPDAGGAPDAGAAAFPIWHADRFKTDVVLAVPRAIDAKASRRLHLAAGAR